MNIPAPISAFERRSRASRQQEIARLSRLEVAGSLEQKLGRVAVAPRREGDLCVHQAYPSVQVLVDRAGLDYGEQGEGVLERSRLVRGLRGRQRRDAVLT